MARAHTHSSNIGFKFIKLLMVCAMTLTLVSCDLTENYMKSDREGEMQMQDYRDGLASRVESPEDEDDTAYARGGNIPELQPYVANAQTNMKSMPLVSVSLNQTVPLRDALYELAQQADYDIELDPRIRGAIIYTARNRPFDVVVERISDIAGLRYKFDEGTVRIELDEPYNKLYKIDYLSYIRSTSSSISNNVAVVTGEGADTGSKFEATSTSEADFWGELETNLTHIINGTQTGGLKTKKSPTIQATSQNPNVESVAADSDGQVNVQAPQATLNVTALPLDEEDLSSEDELEGTFTINKQAGIVNVFANEKAHARIDEYLKQVRQSITSQVLIEAKILEVSLNDEFVTGIDWGGLNLFRGQVTADFLSTGATRTYGGTSLVPSTVGGLTGAGIATGTNFVLGYSSSDVQALIQALSGFGTVKALASPRLTVLNNQSAVLSVATNRVFFDVDIDVTATDGGAVQTDISSDIKNVPEGVLINVQPSINMADQTVSMAVRPTITRVIDSKPDPAVQYITAQNKITGVTNDVPELNVQEIDSLIQVRSGQPVVMGGLLQDRVTNSEQAVPVLGEAPIIGNLFKDRDDLVQKTELVIFLKATILDTPGSSVHNTDKDLYRQFSSDRRPLKF